MAERNTQRLGLMLVPAMLDVLYVVAPALAGGGPIFVSPGGANVTIKTAGTCPPHCNRIGPITGLVGEEITFDAGNSYDPDGEIVQYGWGWTGGQNFEWTTLATITHTWDAPYTGKVRLVVFDNDSECADTLIDVTIANP